MRTSVRRAALLVGALGLLIAIAWWQGIGFSSDSASELVEPPFITVRPTKFLVQRGNYLFHSGAACAGCHTPRDSSRFAMPLQDGPPGRGGRVWDIFSRYRIPLSAPNLTPAALRSWTDGEILNAFTLGVAPKGRLITPLCPWPAYQYMDALDARALIAYLRSLPSDSSRPREPIRRRVFSAAPKNPPRLLEYFNKPLVTDTLAYGGYVLRIAGCSGCHAAPDDPQPLLATTLPGGREFVLSTGARIAASNLTPDSLSGLGRWSESRFVQRFRHIRSPRFSPPEVHPSGYTTPMPWYLYANLSEQDLRALYRFLRNQPAVPASPNPFVPAHP